MLVKNKKRIIARFIYLVALFSCTAFADDPPPTQESFNVQAPGDYSASSAAVSGNETIDPFSGSLTLTYEDLHLPAAGGMDLVITRFYHNLQNPITHSPFKTSSNGRGMLGTGWDIHFGRVWVYGDTAVGVGTIPSSDDKTACKRHEFTSSKSPILELSDGSRQALVDIDDATSNPFSLRSKDNWLATCLPVINDVNGVGGLMVYSPDGKKYTFNDRGMVVAYSGYGPTQSVFAYLVTEIQDMAGNKILISYKDLDGFRVIDTVSTLSAQGEVGPQVTFNYVLPATSHLLASITGEGLAVTYVHTASSAAEYHLTSVILPETNYTWGYTYYDGADVGAYSLETVTNPGGMVTTYHYGTFVFAYSTLYCGEEHCANTVVTQKTVTGGGVDDATWNYSHTVAMLANDIASEVHVGESCTVYEYEGEHKFSGPFVDLYRRGLLMKKTRYDNDDCSVMIEQEENEYQNELWIASVNEFRANPQSISVGTYRALLTKKTITRDGSSYVTSYSSFTGVDVAGFGGEPQQINETGDKSRVSTRNYIDGFSLKTCSSISASSECYVWVGELLDETVNAGSVVSEKSYAYQGNKYGLPMGRLMRLTDNGVTTEYLRNNDGDVYQVTRAYGTTDASVSYAATNGPFERGKPKRIDIYDGLDINHDGVIDVVYDIRIDRNYDLRGNLTQETRSRSGETSVVTVMGYDKLDRLTSVTTPRTDDQNLFFDYSAGNNGYMVTEKRGINVTTPSITTLKHYNAAGALLSEESTDNSSGITLRTRYDNDALNRQIFASFPSTQPLLNINDGLLTSYDDLDRIKTKRYQTGGVPEATWTSYSYVFGNKVQIQDERGFKTTQTFISLGNPDEKFLTKIEQEKVIGGAVVTTVIDRNEVGRINSIVQDGETHSFTYFPTRRIQVETESYPEVGTIKYTRKVSGELTSQQIFSDATLTIPLTGITYFDLNYQRHLVQINYPGTTNDVQNTYDMFNGIKSTLTMTNNSAWSSCFAAYLYEGYCTATYPRTVVSKWTNGYDLNHNLTQEQFSYNGSNYAFGYGYDARDHLATVTYPNNHVVTNSLDNFGRTTAITINDGVVSNLATSVTYFANGQIHDMAFGNGRNATFTQTARKQPEQFSVDGGTLNLIYSYDAVGNLGGVTDSIHIGTRSNLQYDGLNRLQSVTFPGSGTHGFQYNDKNDITQKSIGASSWVYNYNVNNNKLDSISGAEASSFTYDNYGNTATGWGNTYAFDDASQLLTATTPKGSESYQYDGYKRRFRITNNLGSYLTLYNSAGKLMNEIDNNGAGNKRNYVYLNNNLLGWDDNCATAANIALGVCSWLDEDGDNLTWASEEDNQTNPHALDTDGDGFPDPVEIQNGMDPTNSASSTLPLNNSYKGLLLKSTRVVQ